MKSLFGLLSLVLFAGAAIADVPVERRFPQFPPNSPVEQDMVRRDRPANDQPSSPQRDVRPLVLPGVDDPGAPYRADDPNSPPKANRPGENPSVFSRKGPIGELDVVGEDRPVPPLRSMRPVFAPYRDRPIPGPFSPAYPPVKGVMGPNGVLEVVDPNQPVVEPRHIMPVLDPRLQDPKSGPQIVDPVEKPLRSPKRGPIAIADDVPAPRRSPELPSGNLYPDNQGSEKPLYVGLRDGGDGDLDMGRPGPSVRVPNPIFRNLIQVHFGPGVSRGQVAGRLFDMNGRLVYSEKVQGGSSASFSGARLASLPAGSYVLEIDCGDAPKFFARMQKAD